VPVGYIDKVEQNVVYGWAFASHYPGQRWLVDVFVNGVFAGQALANLYREDLFAAGVGDGAHGFVLGIRQASTGPNLTVEGFALGATRNRLYSAIGPALTENRKCKTATDYLKVTFARFASSEESPSRIQRCPAAEQPIYERLVARSSLPTPPICLGQEIGAYQDFIRHRWGQIELFEPTLVSAQYADFLSWYLLNYSLRRGRLRAPLSSGDIAFLNEAQGPDSSVSRAQTIFGALFAAAPPDPSSVARALLWSAYEAAAVSVEDCLISNANRELLSEVPPYMEDQPYPLTQFMLQFLANNPFLKTLPHSTASERSLIYFILLLFATSAPHYLFFVPSRWRDALLEEQSGGVSSLFWLHHTALFGSGQHMDATLWQDLIFRQGFDVARNEFTTKTALGSRIYSAALSFAAETVDLQILGPFSRAHGIGQSCRRLARVLQTLNYEVRYCDYSLDHPNDPIALDDIPLSAPAAARINIIHLNLEDLPTIFAYSPDVFSGAYNIAFPFLELAPPAPSQMLGLSLVNEVWAASQFIADTLAPFCRVELMGSVSQSMPKMGKAQARRHAFGLHAGCQDFIFLTAGDALSSVHRKNPLAAVRAFLNAFPNESKVRLVIKTHSTGKIQNPKDLAVLRALRQICAADTRISLIDSYLDETTHLAMIEGSDAFVSMHRAEGLGFHILEAMTLGVPVIASDYSGNSDFCTEKTAFLVPVELIAVESGLYPTRSNTAQVWAEPDHYVAVEHMRRLYSDKDLRETRVAEARALVESKYSQRVFARKLKNRIASIYRLCSAPKHWIARS
jgi:glycosyltransferase involved in cell wall biosynthesis